MKHYKINDIKFSIPTQWSDVPYGTYRKLLNEKNEGVIIKELTGKDILSLNISGDAYVQIREDLKFFTTDPTKNYIPPKKITIKGNDVELPTDIAHYSIGQYTDLRNSVNDEADNLSMAMAIYLQPLVDGSYNIDKVKYFTKEVDNLPCDLVINLGGFFLMNSLGLKTGLMSNYLNQNIRWMRFRLAIDGFLKRLVFNLHYIIYLKKQP